MGRASQIKSTGDGAVVDSTRKHFAKEERLNLNDLLARRQKEKQIDRKTNRLIFTGVFSLAVLVILILSF